MTTLSIDPRPGSREGYRRRYDGRLRQRMARRREWMNAWLETLEVRCVLTTSFSPPITIDAPENTFPYAIAANDFDGDGDVDLAIASPGNDRLSWQANLDGAGTFGPQQTISDQAIAISAVTAADIDGDGRIDLVTGGAAQYDSDVSWYRNEGGGAFGSANLISADVQGTDSVFAADLDEDGDLDVVSASRIDSKVAWYENVDGQGHFGEQALLSDATKGARTVAAADLDGDGDIDIVSGSYDDDSVWWFENRSLGRFSAEAMLTDTADYVTEVKVADLDKDGKTDILVTSRNDHAVSWIRSLGRGEFAPLQTITLDAGQPYAVEVADVDKDGRNDVLVADQLFDQVVWCRNLGNELFDVPLSVADNLNGASNIVVADVDRDGELDVFASSRLDNQVAYIHHVSGDDFDAPVTLNHLGVQGAQFVSTGDVDRDGDADVLVASFIGDRLSWYENLDGQGSFGPEHVITTRTNGTESAFFADIDGDLDLDAVSASYFDDKLAWYENLDGKGNFGPQRLISNDLQSPEYLDVADMDGDGDVDVLSASRYDGKIAWYENTNGHGLFGPQIIVWTAANDTSFLEATDIDGDGDLDILANDYYVNNSTISWFENVNGRGVFSTQNVISVDVELPSEADAADLDGDGDVDVVVASSYDNRVVWFENVNGDGDFGDAHLISDQLSVPYTVRIADLDGDGDQDIYAGDYLADTLVWYDNDGSGNFGEAQVLAEQLYGANSLAVVDMDNDGDLDALATAFVADAVVWLRNLTIDGTVLADFNGDSRVDGLDLNTLCSAVRTGSDSLQFDLTHDGLVNRNDVNELVVNRLHTSVGDANLDGIFDSSDFVAVFIVGEYEDGIEINSEWTEGDWDCDGEFTTLDLVLAFQFSGFESANGAAPTVDSGTVGAAVVGVRPKAFVA